MRKREAFFSDNITIADFTKDLVLSFPWKDTNSKCKTHRPVLKADCWQCIANIVAELLRQLKFYTSVKSTDSFKKNRSTKQKHFCWPHVHRPIRYLLKWLGMLSLSWFCFALPCHNIFVLKKLQAYQLLESESSYCFLLVSATRQAGP